MKPPFELTDEIIEEALRGDRPSSPSSLRLSVRAALAAPEHGVSVRVWNSPFQLRLVWVAMMLIAALLLAALAVVVGSGLLERRLNTSVLPSPSPALTTPAPTPTVAPTATAELIPSSPHTFSLWQAAGRLPIPVHRAATRGAEGSINIPPRPTWTSRRWWVTWRWGAPAPATRA